MAKLTPLRSKATSANSRSVKDSLQVTVTDHNVHSNMVNKHSSPCIFTPPIAYIVGEDDQKGTVSPVPSGPPFGTVSSVLCSFESDLPM